MSNSGLAGRRVFLIEDESLVAMLIEDALTELGCEIAGVASRFGEAMEKTKSLSFDVAILDLDLNGQRTLPIAEILLDREIPFVFATGYGATDLAAALQGVPILAKPFQQRDLERALCAAIAPHISADGRDC
ncbi:MAG: response regulator [Acidobacteriaceae bacterium]|nr:response regulator [Acidobacteriaceae bacterium]MBV9405652.1 response regulator [Acidobacteriaceae bacterium]MBV9751627.1 response regulator [Hyphomicrobiales bacterium]